MLAPTLCRHAWQLEGVTLGDHPLAWWWCSAGCELQALGAPAYTTGGQQLMLLPAVYVPAA